MLLRAFGLFLIGALAVWIGWTAFSYDQHWQPTPQILGGSGFEGNPQLPAGEIREQLDRARARVSDINERGRWFILGGDICSWLSFACTAAVTLVAGWFGHSAAAPGRAPDTAGLPPRTARTIGLLAGLAAVLTAGGSIASERGHTQYDRAKQAQASINVSVKAIGDAKTAEEARAALDDLKLKIEQL
jgi:hypothetical protein